MRATNSALPLALIALLGNFASGQTVLHTYVESEPSAKAGSSVAIWEDLNGDGYLEWLIGVPDGDGIGTDSGRILVKSGFDNSLLNTLQGPQAGARYGQALANVKDLDGDGVDDLAVGASGMGTVFAYSGATGALLWSTTHPTIATFGWAVSAAGDVNADGTPDVVVGEGRGPSAAQAVVLSGTTGAIILSYAFQASWAEGMSVAGVGDVNSDGHDDIAAGRTRILDTGTAHVIDGATGTMLYDLTQSLGFQAIGASLCGLNDIDGDGVPDFAAGDIWELYIAGGPGYVYVFSGATGSLIWTFAKWGTNELGTSIANAGDVDNDGFDDLIVGDSYSAEVHLISPKRQCELFKHSAYPTIANFGTSVAGGKDIDGDGYLDFVAGGAWNYWSPHFNNPSGARLFTYGLWPDAVYNYCAAVANSTNQRAKMAWQGTTSIANNNFRLSASKCPANKFGLFFYGSAATELPVGDGHLCVSGGLYRTAVVSTGSTGTPSRTLDFTNPPQAAAQISAGDTWYFSFWFRDPSGGPAGFNFADGLRASFCP